MAIACTMGMYLGLPGCDAATGVIIKASPYYCDQYLWWNTNMDIRGSLEELTGFDDNIWLIAC